MSQSQVRTNAEKYNFTAEKAHFAKSSRQGLENLRSDLPKLLLLKSRILYLSICTEITSTKYKNTSTLLRLGILLKT